MQPQSISAVTRHIKSLIDADDGLSDLWVEGEVSNFTRASSGHCYFTLKDPEAELRCVMWRGQVAHQSWIPRQGDWIETHGYVSVYERGGAYQFYADTWQQGGVGARWQDLLALRARLEAEGLFSPDRKRPLPSWPRRIGVVTSPSGAALRDIINVLNDRYPLVELVLSPSLVQGVEAPDALVRALHRLSAMADLDVVIVARGGGSVEDLWAFNDERVVRAVAECPVPVVAGVGHETDYTLIDFVADYRAPTPSAAAAAVVPDSVELRGQIAGGMARLAQIMGDRLERARAALQGQERLLRLYDPRRRLAEFRQRVDDLVRRLRLAADGGLGSRRGRLDRCLASLQALNPREVLARGYAIVQDRASGRYLGAVTELAPAQRVIIHLRDGQADADVTAVHPQEAES